MTIGRRDPKEIRPEPHEPLFVDGGLRAIRSATMTQFLATERWSDRDRRWNYGTEQLSVEYAIELDVDEGSGDDGAWAPDVRVHVRRFPTLALTELAGKSLHVLGDAEGWCGNDAPPLDGLRVVLVRVLSPERMVLRIEATHRSFGQRRPQPFVFEGVVDVRPLATRVQRPDDAARFAALAFGEEWLATMTEIDDGPSPLPGADQPERRMWYRRRFVPR